MRFIALFAMLFISPVAAQDLHLDGDFVQGGMVVGKTSPSAEVQLDDMPVKVSPEGYFVIGFDRDAKPQARLWVRDQQDNMAVRILDVATRDYKVERVDGVPQKTVVIPPEEEARRKKERAMVIAARSQESSMQFWRKPFIWPAKGRISGVYGSQRILNGQARYPHMGLDIAAPTGTPVVSPQAGIVVLAQPDFLLEGGLIILDHGHEVFSSFLHLSGVDVKAGDHVKQGQRIGAIGSTGRSTGPHLDWRMKWKNINIDPALLLDEGGNQAASK